MRGLLMSLALAAVLGLGTAAAWAMQRHERNIEWFLSEQLGYGRRASRAGFTPSGQLQSVTQWKTDGGDRVMLRIFADSAPGYLRGKAFDTYQGSSRNTSYTSWASTVPRESLPEIDINRDLPKVRRQDRIYDLTASQPVDPRVLDVWPEERTMAQIFTPLGATRIAINGGDIKRDSHDIVTINDREEALPYLVFASQPGSWPPADPAAPLSAEEHRLLTSFRDHIDDEVKALARQLFADCRTTRQKLDAVRRHFLENYTYKLGINVPHRMDPITYFLTKRPPAHCEYFATGTAVLLRLADVPCRYVVGYVCQEWNQVGGFWVARNKDAHAWVEAFDEEAGKWVIVESTPSAGVPQPSEPTVASQISGTLRHRISILRMRIREYGITSTLLSLVQMIWSIPGLIVLLGIFAVLLARYRPRGFSLRRRDREPSHLKGMHAALALLERRTRERGFVRPPEQTLTQFATRLRQSSADPTWTSAAADCYALYVKLRYQGHTGPEAVEEFRRAVVTLPTSLTTKHRQSRRTVSSKGGVSTDP